MNSDVGDCIIYTPCVEGSSRNSITTIILTVEQIEQATVNSIVVVIVYNLKAQITLHCHNDLVLHDLLLNLQRGSTSS